MVRIYGSRLQHEKGENRGDAFWYDNENQKQFIAHSAPFPEALNNYKLQVSGVKLDQTLSLREHINSVYKKASGRLYLMKRIRPQLTTKAAQTLYKTMLLPIFTYCSILTSTYTETMERKIASVENRAYSIIYRNLPVHHHQKVSIRNLQKRRICTQVFNCINGNVCDNFKNYFEVMSNNTRNANKLIRLPKVKLESTKKSFRYTGAKEYNNLPMKVRNATSTKEFIRLYDEVFNL